MSFPHRRRTLLELRALCVALEYNFNDVLKQNKDFLLQFLIMRLNTDEFFKFLLQIRAILHFGLNLQNKEEQNHRIFCCCTINIYRITLAMQWCCLLRCAFKPCAIRQITCVTWFRSIVTRYRGITVDKRATSGQNRKQHVLIRTTHIHTHTGWSR